MLICNFRSGLIVSGLAACCAFGGPATGDAQPFTVYAPVLTNKLFVVGAANAMTGLYVQTSSGDTAWTHLGAERIRAFGAAVGASTKGRVVYIASGNGVFKSVDWGRHWKITTGWQITEVLCVTPDPADSNVVYCTTPYGVYRTTDGCASWTDRSNGLRSKYVEKLIIDRKDHRTLYCAADDGAYVSHDGGDRWERRGLSVGHVRTIAQNPADARMLAVGTEDNGIFISRNGGEWWTKAEAGLEETTFYCVSFDPIHPDTMYAGGWATGIYRSVDGGQSWARSPGCLPLLTVHAIAADPTDDRRVFAGTIGSGVYRSDDAGTTWRHIGLGDSQIWTLFVEPY